MGYILGGVRHPTQASRVGRGSEATLEIRPAHAGSVPTLRGGNPSTLRGASASRRLYACMSAAERTGANHNVWVMRLNL